MRSTARSGWRPEGFEDYRRCFPATPELALPDGSAALTEAFIAAWDALEGDPIGAARARLREAARGPLVVALVRGYLGNYMRGNLVPARDALTAAGVDAFIVGTAAGGTVADNARRVRAALSARLARAGPRAELVVGGHSKGGLEALTALGGDPDLRARTRAVLLAQTPRGGSAVLESLLLRAHQASLRGLRRRLAERAQRVGLALLGARPGGLELTGPRLAEVVARVDAVACALPVAQTASWSTRPTVWLDSFHERLGEVRPGVAHDGQFYLADLLWPGVPHVLLPRLDHAQPAMDGFGFDSRRYWLALLVLGVSGRLARR